MSHKEAEFKRFMARQCATVHPLVMRAIGLHVMVRAALTVWDAGRYVPIRLAVDRPNNS